MGTKVASLHGDLQGRAVVLDDRRIPGHPIAVDHIVLAPSGAWLITGEAAGGRVERRDLGGWSRVDERLFVGRADRTELVDSLDQQIQAMERALSDAGLGTVSVHAAVCLQDCHWGWFAKPFVVRGVWVTWPEKMSRLVLDWQAMAHADYERLARVASARLLTAVV
jgi:hypothetical protein